MKKVLIILIIFCIQALFANTYLVEGFSDEYYGEIISGYKADTGVVKIYRYDDSIPLITVKSMHLNLKKHNGSLQANIIKVPYGEHSTILYEDYNFDGKEDFAILTGRKGCYGGPSYIVYLAKGNEFIEWPPLSNLSLGCGMFRVKKETQTLHSFNKSGCCSHTYYTYDLYKDNPRLIVKENKNSWDDQFFQHTSTTYHWKRQQLLDSTVKVHKINYMTGIHLMMPFEHNGKIILMYNGSKTSQKPTYYCLGADSTIEMIFQGPFHYKESDSMHTLSFENNSASYTIYQGRTYSGGGPADSSGIIIRTKGKEYHWKVQDKNYGSASGQWVFKGLLEK